MNTDTTPIRLGDLVRDKGTDDVLGSVVDIYSDGRLTVETPRGYVLRMDKDVEVEARL